MQWTDLVETHHPEADQNRGHHIHQAGAFTLTRSRRFDEQGQPEPVEAERDRIELEMPMVNEE